MEAQRARDNYPETLVVEDIKKILDIGHVQAYKLASSGQFHVVRIGRLIKISRDVFFDWLEGK